MRLVALLVVVAAGGCGLVNGMGYVEHPLYKDAPGFCAACGRAGFSCFVGDDDRICKKHSSFDDCVDGQFPGEDLFLSPAPGESEFVASTGDQGDCPDGMHEALVDLTIYDPGRDAALTKDEQSDRAGWFNVNDNTGFVKEMERTEVDDDGIGAVYFASIVICVPQDLGTVAVKVLEDDGDNSNAVCIDVGGNG